MAPALSPFSRDTAFDSFLFAEVGEERNGMLLSVLSALARLDVDPWGEAATLSKLSAAAATERLSSLLSSLPGSQLTVPKPDAIKQLIGLLPKVAEEKAWSPGLKVVARSRMSWPMVFYFIAAFVIMCAAQFAERRETNPAGGPSLSTSLTDPRAANAPSK